MARILGALVMARDPRTTAPTTHHISRASVWLRRNIAA